MRKLSSIRRGRAVALGVALASVAGAALPLLAPTAASALTGTTGPVSVTVTPTAGLTNGQSISVTGTGTGGSQLFQIQTHICAPGAGISNDFDFSFAGPFCVPDTVPLGLGDREVTGTYGPAPTGTITFKAGTGTASWTDSNPITPLSHTLTCDSSNPCDVVTQFQSTAAGGPFFFTAPITYAGPATAPLTPAATAGDTTATVSWTAPASNGNSTIDYYEITPFDVTTSSALAPINTPTAGLSYTLPAASLTNFHQYTFTIKAHNAAGLGAASAATAPAVSPGPNPPTGVTATPGDSSATAGWTAPSNTTGLDYYRVSAFAGPTFTGPAAATFNTATPVLTGTVLGLTNGTTYKLSVAAHYGASGFGPESVLSGTVTPAGTFVTQIITATRPTGTLDIAEACANGTGTVPAGVGPQFGYYPQTCTVPLGTGTINAAGTYFVATGNISTVSVRDLRSADVGWNVNAQITNFSSAAGNFSGNCLAFTPTATGLGGPAGYTQTIAAGASAPGDCTTGLVASTTVMTGGILPHPNTGGLGRADLTGPLTLNIPVSAPAGAYSATLTFTAI